MEDESEQDSSGPSLAEVLIVSQVIVLGIEIPDLLNWLIVFKIISIAANAAFLIYIYLRKLPSPAVLVTSAVNLIPIADWLPLTVAGYWVAVWLAQQQQKGGLVGKAAGTAIAATSAASGKATATGGASAAASSATAAEGGVGASAGAKTAAATTSTTSAGAAAGGATTQTTASAAGAGATTTAGGYSSSGSAGGTPTSGAAQYAKDIQQEQDPLLQLNKQLTQQTPGTIDRPSGGRDDVVVDDDTNSVQLPYAA